VHKLAMTMAATAAILALSSLGWRANAMNGPGPSKGLAGANDTPRQEAACQGWAGGDIGIVHQHSSARAARIVAGAALATDRRNGDEFPAQAAFCFGRTSAE
jgi:hypothetical protein